MSTNESIQQDLQELFPLNNSNDHHTDNDSVSSIDLSEAIASRETTGVDSFHSSDVLIDLPPNLTTQSDSNTQTQQETSDNNRNVFRDLPELNPFFRFVEWKNRNKIVACKFCAWTTSSNRPSRHEKHVRVTCPGIPQDLRENFVAVSDQANQSKKKVFREQLNIMMASVIIRNNLPFKLVDCPIFAKLIKYLNSEAQLASRQEMSSNFIAKLGRNADRKLVDLVTHGRDYQLSLEFDHWTDLSGRLLVGVIATTADGSRYLLRLDDVSLRGHYSKFILDALQKATVKIPARCINSIQSDSAATCKSAKRLFTDQSDYRHIIVSRCMAHFMNNIGSEFCQTKAFEKTLSDARQLASFASNNPTLTAKLHAINKRKVSKSTAVRWYSTVSMLESLLNVRDEIKEYLRGRKKAGKRDRTVIEVRKTVASADFWTKIANFVKILRPLANCIAVAEQSDSSLGEAVKAIFDYLRSLLHDNGPDELVIAALNAFFIHFNEKKLEMSEIGLIIAAYFLDRRYKMDYVTKEGAMRVLETAMNIATQTGYSTYQLDTILYPEFIKYCKQQFPFNRSVTDGQKASDWWSKISSTCLSEIASRIANLKSSSANIERVFSVIKIFQSPVRTNFDLDTLEAVTKAKLALSNDLEDNRLYEELHLHRSIRNLEGFERTSLEDLSEDDDSSNENDCSQSSSNGSLSSKSSTSNHSDPKRRRFIETTVQLDDSLTDSSNVNPGRSHDNLKLVESAMRGTLCNDVYADYKRFKTLIDFELINQLDDSGTDESEAPVDSVVDKVKERFLKEF